MTNGSKEEHTKTMEDAINEMDEAGIRKKTEKCKTVKGGRKMAQIQTFSRRDQTERRKGTSSHRLIKTKEVERPSIIYGCHKSNE